MRRFLTLLLLLAPTAAFADIAGKPLVMDGDTLAFGDEQVSLYGIHAPSISQSCSTADGGMWSCGWDAANRLEALIAGREVTCADAAADAKGVLRGRCTVAGEDLAGLMVDEGLAVADQETGEDYRTRAMAASEAGIGMWAGDFIDPVTWEEVGDCGCSARKKSMMETAALLKQQREEEEAAAAADAEAATQ